MKETALFFGGAVLIYLTSFMSEKEIRVITPRHEQGLVHAADGYARASGKTGVCLVTSGPGTTSGCFKNSPKTSFLLGGGVHIARAEKEMTSLAEKTGIPVVTTIMGKAV